MLLGLYHGLTLALGPLVSGHLARRVKRSKEWPERLPERFGRAGLPRPNGSLVWLHAASVGESLAALPLIEALRTARPATALLLTVGTVSAATLMQKRLPPGVMLQFAPLDRAAYWRRFLAHWRPQLAVLVESELWPNLLRCLNRQGVPTVVVNARLSARSHRRWQHLPRTATQLFGMLTMVLAQTEADAGRFAELGAVSVRAVGNLKDAAQPLPYDDDALTRWHAVLGARPVLVAASTHEPEEAWLLDALRDLCARVPDLLLVLVPRHPERGDAIADAAAARGHDALPRRSQGGTITTATRVYLADTLGELGLIYRVADVALMGGSLIAHGGQNPLEAARLGVPVLFGSHMDNFAVIAARLLDAGAARRVTLDRLADELAAVLTDPSARAAMAEAGRAVADHEAESLRRTLDALRPFLPPVAVTAPPPDVIADARA